MMAARWYMLPLCAGEHIGRKDRVIIQDGYISTLQVFLLVVCLGFSLTIATWFTHPPIQSKGIKMADLDMTLVTLMVISSVLILCLYLLRIGNPRLHRSRQDMAVPLSCRLRHIVKTKLPLIGIVCFFVPILMLDILKMAAYIDCLPSIVTCGADMIYEYVGVCAFRMSRVCFMGLLVVFALFYHNKQFTRSIVLVRYILMFILASTLVMWFETFWHDFVFATSEREVPQEVFENSSACHISQHNITSNTYNCMTRNTSLFLLSDGMFPFFYPLNIEFALLMSEIVAHAFFSLSKVTKNRRRSYLRQQQTSSYPDDGDIYTETEDDRDDLAPRPCSSSSRVECKQAATKRSWCEDDDDDEEEAPLITRLESSGTDDEKSCRYGSVNAKHHSAENGALAVSHDSSSLAESSKRRAKLVSSGILALVMNVIMVTIALQMNNSPFYFDLLLYNGYRVFFQAANIGSMYLAMARCSRFLSRHQPYTGLETLVMVSTAGFYLNAFLSLVSYCACLAGTHGPGAELLHVDPVLPALAIASKLLDTFAMFVQTSFMLHVTRILAPQSSYRETNSLKQCIMVVTISNVCLWTLDSFIQVKSLKTLEPMQIYFYGEENWSMLTHVSLPLTIFYRFNSFFILLGAFLDH